MSDAGVEEIEGVELNTAGDLDDGWVGDVADPQDEFATMVEDHAAGGADPAVQRLFGAYTIVRPTRWASLDQLPFVREGLAQGVFPWPRRDTSLAPIAPDDVAATIAALLLAPVPGRRILPLTGPETLTIDEIAVHYASALGRPVDVLDLTPDSYIDWLTQHTPMTREEAAGATATLMPIADRREAPVSDAVETVTGHPPQRFDDYLAANFSPGNDG